MANNNSYFYISGFISISFFFFFLSIVVLMSFVKVDVEVYALKKDKYMSVSMTTPKKQTSIKEKTIVDPVKEEAVAEPKDVNIDDLFSDVWTKSIKKTNKKKKKIVDTKRFLDIAKKSKKIDNNTKKVSKNINNNSAKKSEVAEKTSTGTAVNEYIAKIKGLVYENFSPPENSEGHSVKAVIELSAIGKVMDFRILVYSANSNLNDECDKIKERLIGVLFPLNIQNRSFSVIVNLTSDI